MPQTIYPLTRIVVLELAENAVDLQAFGTVECGVCLLPFEDRLTEHREVKHMHVCFMYILSEPVNLFHFTLQYVHLLPLVQVRIYDTTN